MLWHDSISSLLSYSCTQSCLFIALVQNSISTLLPNKNNTSNSWWVMGLSLHKGACSTNHLVNLIWVDLVVLQNLSFIGLGKIGPHRKRNWCLSVVWKPLMGFDSKVYFYCLFPYFVINGVWGSFPVHFWLVVSKRLGSSEIGWISLEVSDAFEMLQITQGLTASHEQSWFNRPLKSNTRYCSKEAHNIFNSTSPELFGLEPCLFGLVFPCFERSPLTHHMTYQHWRI